MNEARQLLERTALGNSLGERAEKVATASTTSANKNRNGRWLLEGVIYQQCAECGRSFYPVQPLCPRCLSTRYNWEHDRAVGRLLTFTNVHISFNLVYRNKGPWRIGFVAHSSGPTMCVFLDDLVTNIGQDVALFMAPDATGGAVYIGVPTNCDVEGRALSIAERIAVLKSN